MPKDKQDTFGTVEFPRIGTEYLSMPVEKAEEILSALEEQGYTCRRDDDLVKRATLGVRRRECLPR